MPPLPTPAPAGRWRRDGLCPPGRLAFLLVLCVLGSSCARLHVVRGEASYYSKGFRHHRTADGERFHPDRRTAASRDLPFGTRVWVINLRNRKRVKVRINDRGPFVRDRIIDLSRKAARKLDMLRSGVAPVELRYRLRRRRR